jgi:hypothetical protein
MSGRLHADPDDLEAFASNLEVPNYVMSTTVGEQACAGQGVPDCLTLRSALELAVLKANQLAKEMQAGMQSFQNITRTCANDYDMTDTVHTAAITGTMAATPEQIAAVNLHETQELPGAED